MNKNSQLSEKTLNLSKADYRRSLYNDVSVVDTARSSADTTIKVVTTNTHATT